MSKNIINLKFDNTISGLAGNEYGASVYKQQLQDKIDLKNSNIIIFPDNIKRVAISFIQGMFNEILKKIDKQEIEKYIEIQTSYQELTEKIISNIKF